MECYANNYMKWPEEAQLCPFEIFAIILKLQELRRLPYLMSSKTLQVLASSFSQTKWRRLDYISLNINRKSLLSSPLLFSALFSVLFSSHFFLLSFLTFHLEFLLVYLELTSFPWPLIFCKYKNIFGCFLYCCYKVIMWLMVLKKTLVSCFNIQHSAVHT